jgi:hypothetical protein
MTHLSREDEGLHVTLYTVLLLEMTQKMPEVNVKEASGILLEHIVAGVSITNSKDVGGCTLPRGAFYEIGMILKGRYLPLEVFGFFRVEPKFLFNII